MRIQSKFQDYYDSGIAYGMDEKIVYERHAVEYEAAPSASTRVPAEWIEATKHAGLQKSYDRTTIKPPVQVKNSVRRAGLGDDLRGGGVVFFCGRRYPFYSYLKVETPATFEKPEVLRPVYHWDDEFKQNVSQGSWSVKHYGSWRDWLERETGQRCDEIHLQHNSPVILLHNSQKLVVNPCLKEIRFHKVIEPHAAFQEISMYIGSVLNNAEPPPAPQTDKQKVVSHGLDPIYGFRTPPKT